MQSLSNQVKQRDGYRCRLCHSPKQIEAHHLFGKQRFPKLEYNISNLITLCKKCHTRFHRYCPGGINTGADFLLFLNYLYEKEKHTRARSLEKQLLPIVRELEKVAKQEEKEIDEKRKMDKSREIVREMMDINWERVEPKYEVKLTIRDMQQQLVHYYIKIIGMNDLKKLVRHVCRPFKATEDL
jgi:hypothetical protein